MTGPEYFAVAKTREGVLRKCRKESAKKWIAQGSMLMDTRNDERHVSLVACNSEEKALETDDDLGTST